MIWKEGGPGMRTSRFKGVRDICLPGSVCKKKRKINRFNQKLAANPSQRHMAKPIAGNGVFAGDGQDADGVE